MSSSKTPAGYKSTHDYESLRVWQVVDGIVRSQEEVERDEDG